ncbi:MAG: metallophosphoesterase [Thermoproteota archaeon]|nr:metallophosphoesterase [Thermoproteota archaeon]
MKIGLISDTHDNFKTIESAVQKFRGKRIDCVLHAGDITTPEAVEAFAGLKTIGVLGNNDLDKRGLNAAFEKIGGELRGELCEIEEDDLLIAVYHGTDFRKREALIHSGKYNVVVYGHTHKIDNKIVGRTIVINPGTANGWFFGYNATAAIFDTVKKDCDFINL